MSKISYAVFTHVGKVRDNNEDDFYANGKYKENITDLYERYSDASDDERRLYAVCDGMGGEALGEVASLIAVKTLAEYQAADMKTQVMDYITKANKAICDEAEKNDGVRIGTTLALLYINAGRAVAYNIGDSRIYHFRKGRLEQLSEDHTKAQLLVKMGIIKKEAAGNHWEKHKLTQHLGINPEDLLIEPYVSREIGVKKNDIFLLCSDGLTDMVSDEDIAKILDMKETSAADLADKLVKTALANGGRDNVTVVVVKVEGQDGFWDKIF